MFIHSGKTVRHPVLSFERLFCFLRKEDEMTAKIITLVIMTAVLGLHAPCAFAARSLSKSFKLSVTLPASVRMAPENTADKTRLISKTGPREVTEKTVITADHQKILLRTTVVK